MTYGFGLQVDDNSVDHSVLKSELMNEGARGLYAEGDLCILL